MEIIKETYGEAVAAIIAGLNLCDRPTAIKLLENIDKVIYIEGKGHYKKICYYGLKTDTIKINCTELELLLPPGKLNKEHESYWVNFNHVKYPFRDGRDTKAMMSNKEAVCIRRSDAKAFIKRCKDEGKIKPKEGKTDNM